MKNGLNGKIVIAFAALKGKTYSILTSSNNEDKKKHTKWALKFENYENGLELTQLENKMNKLGETDKKELKKKRQCWNQSKFQTQKT